MYKIRITADFFSPVNPEAVPALEALGCDVKEKDYLEFNSYEEYVEFISDADAICVGIEPCDAKTLSQVPNLKLIARRGVGIDNIDQDYCREHGIEISRTVGAVAPGVAELTASYILYFARDIGNMSREMHENTWNRYIKPGLPCQTLGIIGMGNIGRELIMRMKPFGVRMIYTARSRKEALEQEYGIERRSLEELLRESDYVVVAIPLGPETTHFIGEKELSMMKKSAVLINVARGPVVDNLALAEALKKGVIHGAATDVYDEEPCTSSPLAGIPNVILTPHCAAFSTASYTNMNNMSLAALIKGAKEHMGK